MTLQKKLTKKKKGHQDSESDEDDDYRIYYTPTEVMRESGLIMIGT